MVVASRESEAQRCCELLLLLLVVVVFGIVDIEVRACRLACWSAEREDVGGGGVVVVRERMMSSVRGVHRGGLGGVGAVLLR